jgi:hypothetical protein
MVAGVGGAVVVDVFLSSSRPAVVESGLQRASSTSSSSSGVGAIRAVLLFVVRVSVEALHSFGCNLSKSL